MTNGEKFQQIFAVSQVDECDLNVYAWLPCHDAIEIPLEWWNTNYSEIPTGSTTKNDLGVDREDAVERLNVLKQFIGYDKDSEIVKATQKSLDMAIKALEHPEKNVVAVVPCGDTISRQAVIDLMMQKWSENFSGDDAMQESIDAIKVMPSVTPQEPKTGHWIKGYTFPDGAYWKCDKCNELIKVKIPMRYCNNCGAKMVEPQESEG